MTPLSLYMAAGAALFALGLYGAVARAHLVWKILAVNLMGSGVFLILLTAPPRLSAKVADPVPQAMVLTGIVVAVGATAVALGLVLRVAARTGLPYLSEELPPGRRPGPTPGGDETIAEGDPGRDVGDEPDGRGGRDPAAP